MDLSTLAQYFTSKLNATGEKFIAGYLIQTAGEQYEFKTYTNYYTEVTTKYIPAMYSLISDPQKVPEKDITNWNILVGFVLEGDSEQDQNLIDAETAIETFRTSINNNPLDTLNGYRVAASCSNITTEQVKTKGGGKRIEVSLELDVTTGLGIYYGNNVTFETALTGGVLEPIFLVSSSIENGKTEDSTPNLVSNSGLNKSKLVDSTITYTASFIYDATDIQEEILKSINGFEGNINKEFDIKYTFPKFNLEKTVVVSGGTVSMNSNDIMTITVKMVESG